MKEALCGNNFSYAESSCRLEGRHSRLVEKTGSDPSGTRRFSNLDFSGRETVFDPYGVNCPSGPESVGSGNLSNLAFAGELLSMVEHSGYL